MGLSGALTYAYSPKTSFDLSVSNDFSNSALGTSQEVFAIRTSGKFEFTPQWSAGLGLSHGDLRPGELGDFDGKGRLHRG